MCLSVYVWSTASSYTVTHKVDWPFVTFNVKHKPLITVQLTTDVTLWNNMRFLLQMENTCWRKLKNGAPTLSLFNSAGKMITTKWNWVTRARATPGEDKLLFSLHLPECSTVISLRWADSPFSPGDGSSQPISMSVGLHRRSAELIALHLAGGGPMHLRQSSLLKERWGPGPSRLRVPAICGVCLVNIPITVCAWPFEWAELG